MTKPHALVIGASRGIGLGLVRELASRGWTVIGTARDLSKATELTALAAASGGAVRTAVVDTADAASAETLRDSLKDEVFDLVLVNAGVGGPQDMTTRMCRVRPSRTFLSPTPWRRCGSPNCWSRR